MLRSMTLDNLLSFRHIQFDLSGRSGRARSCAFVYGENGSGKSNLIDALFLVKVCSGTSSYDGSLRDLAKSMRAIGSEGPMRLDLEYVVDDSLAKYMVEFGEDGSLLTEMLESKVNSRRGTLFRWTPGEEPYMVRGLVRDYRVRNGVKEAASRDPGERTLLSILAGIAEDMGESAGYGLNRNLLSFIGMMDRTVVVSARSPPAMTCGIVLPNGRIDPSRERELDALEKAVSSFLTRSLTDVVGAHLIKDRTDAGIVYELMVSRRMHGIIRDIPASMESSGVRRMIGILPALLSCVGGGCAFMDGIDENLHEGMLEGIIGQMLPDIDGQLIATVHDTTLMDSLPAESVYTIAIDMDGYKAVRCVTSIERVRRTNSIRRKYLGGSFGGVPYLADMGLKGIAEELREDLGEEEDLRRIISSS